MSSATFRKYLPAAVRRDRPAPPGGSPPAIEPRRSKSTESSVCILSQMSPPATNQLQPVTIALDGEIQTGEAQVEERRAASWGASMRYPHHLGYRSHTFFSILCDEKCERITAVRTRCVRL